VYSRGFNRFMAPRQEPLRGGPIGIDSHVEPTGTPIAEQCQKKQHRSSPVGGTKWRWLDTTQNMPQLPKWLVKMRISQAEVSTDWDGSIKHA
jgi:hypothetical protein